MPLTHFTVNVSRLTINDGSAHVAQLAEHVLGKDEVTRSIRVVGSILHPPTPGLPGQALCPWACWVPGYPLLLNCNGLDDHTCRERRGLQWRIRGTLWRRRNTS